MPETTYTYDIAKDLPLGSVDTTVLQSEIKSSTITTNLYINTKDGVVAGSVITGGSMDIVFENVLSSADKTTLDGDASNPAGGLLAAHFSNSKYIGIGQHIYASLEDESYTTSTKPVTILTLAVDRLSAGIYRINWYSEVNGNTSPGLYDFIVHNATIDTELAKMEYEPKDPKTWIPFSGISTIELADNGPLTIELQYLTVDGKTAGIRRSKLELTVVKNA